MFVASDPRRWPTSCRAAIASLQRCDEPFKVAQALAEGASHAALSVMVGRGRLKRLAHGVSRVPQAAPRHRRSLVLYRDQSPFAHRFGRRLVEEIGHHLFL
ncbi:hypothetical protein B8W66_20370 [Mycobacterium decipiens]|uniref:Uncharacterized protein n=1 Tax=Mycobacterium decipiens TaxID=1430326 RepID=A0A1X2LQB3_9MYCO|nr:hypothetical protein B8W66_20370 [Mycobacterium decipiens]